MKDLNIYGLSILGIDTFWRRRVNYEKRLIVVVGELSEEELYLVNSICFSVNLNYCKRQTLIVRLLPKWAKKDDTVLDFGGLVPNAKNVIGLPYPREILQEPNLKRKIWGDLSMFFKRNSD